MPDFFFFFVGTFFFFVGIFFFFTIFFEDTYPFFSSALSFAADAILDRPNSVTAAAPAMRSNDRRDLFSFSFGMVFLGQASIPLSPTLTVFTAINL